MKIEEKGLLRSLFLAYTYSAKKASIENMLHEVFKFFKHSPDRFDFFQQMFAFLTEEDYLSVVEREELFNKYLTPPQKENVMNTVQALRLEGKLEGKHQVVLRGIWKGASAEFLADLSELPYLEVEKLFDGYDKAYEYWQNNKKDKKDKETLMKISVLSEQEVDYLMDLFDKK